MVADERWLIGEQDRAVLGQQQHAVDRTCEHPLVDGGEELVVASALHRTLGIRGDEQGLEHVDRELAGVPGRVGLELALQVPGHAVGRARPDEEDQRERDEDVSQLSPSMPPIGHGCPRPCVLPRLSAAGARNLSAIREPWGLRACAPRRGGPRPPRRLRGQELRQGSEGPTAVADPVLLLVPELGHRASFALGDEDRVVAEPPAPPAASRRGCPRRSPPRAAYGRRARRSRPRTGSGRSGHRMAHRRSPRSASRGSRRRSHLLPRTAPNAAPAPRRARRPRSRSRPRSPARPAPPRSRAPSRGRCRGRCRGVRRRRATARGGSAR